MAGLSGPGSTRTSTRSRRDAWRWSPGRAVAAGAVLAVVALAGGAAPVAATTVAAASGQVPAAAGTGAAETTATLGAGGTRSPVGRLDRVLGTTTTVEVHGWAADPDTAAPVDVHVYVDGQARHVQRADRDRPDVGAAYPALGPAHGFSAAVGQVAAGRHTVCVYAIDADGTSANTALGCGVVDVVDGQAPIGRVDGVFGVPGGWGVRGWAIDPDTASPIDVHTYVDGRAASVTTALENRPDVGAAFPAEGPLHGFTTRVATGARAQVCSYAINVSGGSGNTTLGCRSLVRPVEPVGALDAVTRTDPSLVQVRGWTVDPDTVAVVQVHVYVDGIGRAIVQAGAPRPDLAAAVPAWGTGHGFDVLVPAAPGSRVCAYAINTGLGSRNTTLGCRTA